MPLALVGPDQPQTVFHGPRLKKPTGFEQVGAVGLQGGYVSHPVQPRSTQPSSTARMISW
jgi:hypothetical protein